MTHKFHELLLSELRMVSYLPGNPDDMTDDLLCEAVTMNENLRSLGITLRPDDLLRLAVSPSLEDFYETVKALIPDVKARPMYPGFPQQVMEMSEAEFRLHQMIHYFSTYGIEMLLGTEVKHDWLPEYDGPERTISDTALLECRVVELIPENEAPAAGLKILLNRRERLTNPELELVKECILMCRIGQLQGLEVRLKENAGLLFPLLMGIPDRKAALEVFHMICQHTGDVFRCSKDYLSKKRWHLSTSEKRLLVKLLESYTALDLQQNMMWSVRLRERNLLILQHLDYNRFSRSAEHQEAVRALRAGELLSWQGIGEKLLHEHNPEALDYFAQRPGYMLRMLNRLLSMQYRQECIEKALLPAAGGISGHLLVKTIRILMKRRSEVDNRHAREVEECRNRYQMEQWMIPPEYNFFRDNLKNEIAMRRRNTERQWRILPQQEARQRAYQEVETLQKASDAKTEELQRWKSILKRVREWQHASQGILLRKNANADMKDDFLAMVFRENPEALEETLKSLEEEAMTLRIQIKAAQEAGDRLYTELDARIQEKYAAELTVVNDWAWDQFDCLEESFALAVAEYNQIIQTLPERMSAELAGLRKRHEAELRMMEYDVQSVDILKKLLKQHFRQTLTPLRGKKVFFDLDQFDLIHSVLETEDRSRDGGYIRSGISYRIPQDARYVRFFVYWNDRERVDLDLHAAGVTTDGQPLHVGWNADIRNNGVVHSGDITHSDAAEYIDIDLSAPVREISANINLFFGKSSFRRIETCYVGLMAVDQIGQNVKHYNPANCFFTHVLTQKTRNMFYGYINVQDRFVRFIGQPNQNGWGDWTSRAPIEEAESMFSLKEYLDCVMEGQSAQYTQDPNEADIILSMGKSLKENAVSLADNNFFLEC